MLHSVASVELHLLVERTRAELAKAEEEGLGRLRQTPAAQRLEILHEGKTLTQSVTFLGPKKTREWMSSASGLFVPTKNCC